MLDLVWICTSLICSFTKPRKSFVSRLAVRPQTALVEVEVASGSLTIAMYLLS